MAECKPASEGSSIVSSCERILADFQAMGRPAAPAYNALPGVNVAPQTGEYSIELEVKTPRVGTGFIEWGTTGWDPEGRIPNPPAGVDYNRKGDWLYDKEVAPADGVDDDRNYRLRK